MASRPQRTKFLPLTDSSRSEELKEPKKNFLKCAALDRFSKRVFLAFFNAIWLFLWQSHFFFKVCQTGLTQRFFWYPLWIGKVTGTHTHLDITMLCQNRQHFRYFLFWPLTFQGGLGEKFFVNKFCYFQYSQGIGSEKFFGVNSTSTPRDISTVKS